MVGNYSSPESCLKICDFNHKLSKIDNLCFQTEADNICFQESAHSYKHLSAVQDEQTLHSTMTFVVLTQ